MLRGPSARPGRACAAPTRSARLHAGCAHTVFQVDMLAGRHGEGGRRVRASGQVPRDEGVLGRVVESAGGSRQSFTPRVAASLGTTRWSFDVRTGGDSGVGGIGERFREDIHGRSGPGRPTTTLRGRWADQSERGERRPRGPSPVAERAFTNCGAFIGGPL